MKAIRYQKYGPPDVLQMQEVDKPVPKENQVLIKIHASSINAVDYHSRRAKPFIIRPMLGGLLGPKDPRLGSDVAGRVEAVGAEVKQFRPGDEVFGFTAGAFAEYACSRETSLTLKPANLSFEEAASVPVGGITALQGLRDVARIQPGQKVLIQGASGSVGIFAVQLAKVFGAEVTAVCSTRNLDMARSLGADHVIDYTREDFTRDGGKYDLIFAVNGYHSLWAYRRALNPGGIYVCAGGTMPQIFEALLLGPLVSRIVGKKLRSMGISKINQDDLAYLAELLKDGKIRAVIDRRYPLSQVAEAFRYVEGTHPQGKVVITVA
ncbi:MAG TPA: NAD(P)-dependent alcohol dehydrogenase [Anaerolineales bacterium]|nr:NAD(P)-dependent alcohol dehydrogenase [Anaerolineales bacterium]